MIVPELMVVLSSQKRARQYSAMTCRSSRAGRVAAAVVLLASLCADLMVKAGYVAKNLETTDFINEKRVELSSPNSSRIDSVDVNSVEQTETRHGRTAEDWTGMKIAVGGIIPILILSTLIILAIYSGWTAKANPIYKYYERRHKHQILYYNFNSKG